MENLTELILGEGVETIGEGAFSSCSDLTSVTLSCKEIGQGVFSYMSKLTNVVLNEGVEVIGDHAFRYCSKITSINFPSTLKLIEGYAFNGCSGIENITIPDGVEEIGEGAFWDCYKMKTLTLGSGIKIIGTSAFQGCSSLTDIYCRATDIPEIGWNPFDWEAYEKITLHVPSASLANYKAHEEWGQFKNIVAM